jgi:hypothetical protein
MIPAPLAMITITSFNTMGAVSIVVCSSAVWRRIVTFYVVHITIVVAETR